LQVALRFCESPFPPKRWLVQLQKPSIPD